MPHLKFKSCSDSNCPILKRIKTVQIPLPVSGLVLRVYAENDLSLVICHSIFCAVQPFVVFSLPKKLINN